MKRPPELLLLSAVLLCVVCQHINALRGTELIFRKTSTTSTTTEQNVPEAERRKDEEVTTTPDSTTETLNTTKNTNITGIPQLDYIYDPNLPRELNGYNLSSYPFYNGMPEDIDFKCDGLHDGFYASVVHKCQVYHHCLFGTRFDFLCANYTAFDQKTFICHFVSEVDCVNSPKYFFRNDVLYQAASTTTLAPPPPVVISPALSAAARRPHPGVRRPKPPPRRRPQYDYYDEEYDDEVKEDDYEEPPPPRRRRKRPRRPRPRPIYDDDYDDYEDDRYERRKPGRNKDDNYRQTHDRREQDERDSSSSKKESSRDDLEEDKLKEDRRKPMDYNSRDEYLPSSDRKKPTDSRNRDEDTNKEERRKPGNSRNREEDNKEERRKPTDYRSRDEDDNKEERRKPTDYRNRDEDSNKEERRKPTDYRSRDEDPVKGERRKPTDYKNREEDREERRKPTNNRNREENDRDRYNVRDERKPYDRREQANKNDHRNRNPPENGRESEGRRPANRPRGYDDDDRYDKGSDEPYRYDRDRRKGDDRKRRPIDDEPREEERRYGKRPSSNRDDTRPLEGASSYDSPRKSNRKPYDDFYDDEESDDRRSYDRPRKNNNNNNNNRDRPPSQGDKQNADRPRANESKEKDSQENHPRGLVKPVSSSSVFNQPRILPKIKPPVPKNEQNKFAPKSTTEKIAVTKVEKDEEYYEDYEDEPSVELNRDTKPIPENNFPSAPTGSGKDTDVESKKAIGTPFKPRVQMFRRPVQESVSDYIDDKPKPRQPSANPNYEARESQIKSNTRTRQEGPLVEKDDEPLPRAKPKASGRERTTSQPILKQKETVEFEPKLEPASTTTTTVSPRGNYREPIESFVKIVKRPFLPSRGGSPYLPRGLQPVGAKSAEKSDPYLTQADISSPAKESEELDDGKFGKVEKHESRGQKYEANDERKAYSYENLKAVPLSITKQQPSEYNVDSTPQRAIENTRSSSTYLQNNPPNLDENEEDEEIRPVSNRPETVLRQHSKVNNYEIKNVEKPREPERNPLDISEDEYDVTLNDALNPTIPNLPIRNFPSSYSSAANDYTYSNFQRSRYDPASNQATENRYQQVRAPSENVEANIQENRKRYPTQYTSQTEQIYQNYRPASHITQAQTRGYYSLF